MKEKILKALQEQGYQALYVKGVFVLNTGERLTRKQAMKITGIVAEKQIIPPKRPLYGDYAWMAAINGVK